MSRKPIEGLEAYEASPEQNAAFREGMKFAHGGGYRDDCPYPAGHPLLGSWTDGFCEGYDPANYAC